MVVAASGDGILISDKERSGYMKPYVEKISSDVMFAEKSWGTYTVIDAQPGAMTVRVKIKADNAMSYHSHEHRDEVWSVLSGCGKVTLNDEVQFISAGSVIRIPRKTKHSIMAETDLTVIEVQIGDEISVQDKKKYKN